MIKSIYALSLVVFFPNDGCEIFVASALKVSNSIFNQFRCVGLIVGIDGLLQGDSVKLADGFYHVCAFIGLHCHFPVFTHSCMLSMCFRHSSSIR